ncbi:MAG: endonuclease/exonuclease/phosphatase family protein [Ignavibacteriales bacterium]|nr:endonuclease/exonuclease/phosphatase family protein [Ignavibacteriales bacterium]
MSSGIALVNFRQTIRLALLFAAASGLLLSAGCSSSRYSGSGSALRIMTWNIHHGEGLDRKVDVDRIAKIILSEKPDVVALQEVDRGVERSGKIDIITRLADLTDMTYAFGKTISYQGGDYGNAFLTRFPILEERNLLYKMIHPGEQRGLLQVVLDVRGEEIVVANTHLESRADDSARSTSAAELTRALRGYSSRPVILCGDFNDVPGSRVIAELKKDFRDSWDQVARGAGFPFPSEMPGKRIDYIFMLNSSQPDSASAASRLRAVSARVLQSSASDHLPLIVEFELRTDR